MGYGDFNSTFLRNLKAVKFGKDGGIEVPVRANGRDGIVFGVDAIAKADEAAADQPHADPVRNRPTWRRLLRRRG